MKELNNRQLTLCSSAANKQPSRLLLMALLLLAGIVVSTANAVPHSSREKAKRIHDRIAGVPPSAEVLNDMAGLIAAGQPLEAAQLAIDNDNFYNVTLKTHVAPWTNRDQTQFVDLNDYIATVIGMVYADDDFRDILSTNILYTYTGNNQDVADYSANNNQHYQDIEAANINIGAALKANEFEPVPQQGLNGLPLGGTSGVLTSRAAAEAFFVAGTNRAMFRFTMLNHMCLDLEQVQDGTRVPDRIRQDITRSPGGDSRIYMNSCITCHDGMDPMAGAFAFYDFNTGTGRIEYTPDNVQAKYTQNSLNFPFGYITVDESWINYWRDGPNQWIGWENGLPGKGTGAASMATEMAHSQAFAQCHVEKVFETVCLREPANSADRSQIDSMVGDFNASHNLKEQFKEAAVHCMGDEETT